MMARLLCLVALCHATAHDHDIRQSRVTIQDSSSLHRQMAQATSICKLKSKIVLGRNIYEKMDLVKFSQILTPYDKMIKTCLLDTSGVTISRNIVKCRDYSSQAISLKTGVLDLSQGERGIHMDLIFQFLKLIFQLSCGLKIQITCMWLYCI